MNTLASRDPAAPRREEKPLSPSEISDLRSQLPSWQVLEREGVDRLQRTFAFNDFAQALAFTNRVGELAEAHGHHPTLVTEWGKVTVTWWTHSLGGLHLNDFILADQTDRLYGSA
jgi:4a-hydroxytetrahydrobiopterin dehydratase